MNHEPFNNLTHFPTLPNQPQIKNHKTTKLCKTNPISRKPE
jgi:hypothetical protein